MVETASTMLPLGTDAPNFNLPDVTTDHMISLETFANQQALLVMFISKHCPYVQHIAKELARLAMDYRDKGVGMVAISANDVSNYPDDSPQNLAQMASDLGFPFPVCYDEDQKIAQAYQAACTPDFFLFNRERRLVYRGQLDSSRPGNDHPVTGLDLRTAIDAVLKGDAPDPNQKVSLGCNIKWKPGNEPWYFKA